MGNIKRVHPASFKAKVALELIKENGTVAAVCSRYSIHPTQANQWKSLALTGLQASFSGKPLLELKVKDEMIGELYKQIGQLKVELDWLKKKWALSDKERLKSIEVSNQNISIIRQCELLGVNRSNFYYQPVPVSPETLALMNRIDEIYTEFPYYDSPRMTAELHRQGIMANHKAIERLMRLMGIQGIYPKKKTTIPHPDHLKYPYLLNRVHANHPNHIWGTDITYVRANGLWFYLVVILDWFSRYVLAWRLSPVMTVDFCATALTEALAIAIPEFHNSDQGSQFTSEEYIALFKQHPSIQISMDGRGRCFDNIFPERLWRTVKYEEVYLHDYGNYAEARNSLGSYFHTYNQKRLHQSLDYHTPAAVYFQK